jgi:hypothetical protein
MTRMITSPSASNRRGGSVVTAMSPGALAAWLDSYDAWVALWNEHEQSKSLPLSPEWGDATVVPNTGAPMVELRFIPRPWVGFDCHHGVIRMNPRGWKPYAEGWSFCRTPAPRPVVGGWWVQPKAAWWPHPENPEPLPEGHPNGVEWAMAAWRAAEMAAANARQASHAPGA